MPRPKQGPPSRYECARDEHARFLILAALRAAGGNRTRARESLGLDHRSLYREIARLDLWPQIQALAAEHGWTVTGPAHVEPPPPAPPKRTRKRRTP